jgi:hypothetical protein
MTLKHWKKKQINCICSKILNKIMHSILLYKMFYITNLGSILSLIMVAQEKHIYGMQLYSYTEQYLRNCFCKHH